MYFLRFVAVALFGFFVGFGEVDVFKVVHYEIPERVYTYSLNVEALGVDIERTVDIVSGEYFLVDFAVTVAIVDEGISVTEIYREVRIVEGVFVDDFRKVDVTFDFERVMVT